MASSAIPSQGTLVQRGNGATPEVFTTIAEVKTATGLGSGQAKKLPATHLNSTRVEFKMGLPDEGDVKITSNYIPTDAQQQGLFTDRENQTLRNFRYVYPSGGGTFTFPAFVLSAGVDLGVDELLEFSVTLGVADAVVRT